MIKIDKNVHIIGKSIILRSRTKDDANFVFEMRTNERKNTFLHKIQGNVEDQRIWLESSYADPYQIYFVICTLNGDPVGLVRLYDQKGDSFCWGSWLIIEGARASTAIESALLLYKYALNDLGFKKSHFDVRIGNEKVISFHKKFGAIETGRNEQDIFFQISEEKIRKSILKYNKFL